MSDETIELTVHLHMETEKAIFVSDDGIRSHAVWLPLQFVEADKTLELNKAVEITVPVWLATKRGLV